MKSVFILLVTLILAAQGAQFTASVTVVDPKVSGFMTGTFYYTDQGKSRIDYSVGVIVITDYTQKLSWKQCPSVSCEATATNIPALKFIKDSSFTQNGAVYTANANSVAGLSLYVSQIYVDSNGNTNRAVTNTGVTYTFSNYQTNFDNSVFSAYQGWNCPTTTCNQPVDAILVFDNSGSIQQDQWNNIVSFAQQFANSFEFGNTATRMGLVWFGNDAQAKTLDGNGKPTLVNSKQSFINNVNLPRPTDAQSSCIGCGLDVALKMFDTNSRPGIPRIILVLSDGQNNVPNVERGCHSWDGNTCSGSAGRKDGSGTNWLDVVPRYKNYANLTVFGVGVGVSSDKIVTSIMTQLSSANSYIPIGDYNALKNSVAKITAQTCPATNNINCNCNGGFCGCGGKCVCPSYCAQTNCTSSACTVGGLGCNAPVQKICTSDKCNTPSCVESRGGCISTPIRCTSSDGCQAPSCDPNIGCQLKSNLTSCAGYDACTFCKNNACGKASSCVCLNKVCPPCTKCDPNSATAECIPIDCNDGNACTTDSCDATSGSCKYTNVVCDDKDACTIDQCDSKTGCFKTPINVTEACEDYNPCTKDSCLPSVGCVHANITCTLANSTACTDLTCDPFKGCPTELVAIDCATVGNFSVLMGDCQTIACNDTTGCFLRVVEGKQLDACGFCPNSNLCKIIVGLTAGAIAGIAVGAAAGAAIIGAAGKKGFDYFSAGQAAAGGVQNNPMYESNSSGGANPMYDPTSR